MLTLAPKSQKRMGPLTTRGQRLAALGHSIQRLAPGIRTEQNPKAVCRSKGPGEAAHRATPNLPSSMAISSIQKGWTQQEESARNETRKKSEQSRRAKGIL